MNRLRGIRIALTGVLVFLVLILIYSFNKPTNRSHTADDPVMATEPGDIISADMSVIGGEQILYRDQEPYAKLTFDEATQSEAGTTVNGARLEIMGRGLFLLSRKAEIDGSQIRFLERVTVGGTNELELELAPPVRYTDGRLSGAGIATLKRGDLTLSGISFVLNMDRQLLQLGRSVALQIGGENEFRAVSMRGIARFDTESIGLARQVTFSLVDQQRAISGEADWMWIDSGERVQIRGKCRFYTDTQRVAGIGFMFRRLANGLQINSDQPVTIGRLNQYVLVPVLRGPMENLHFPWAIFKSKDSWLSLGPGELNMERNRLTGIFPTGTISGHEIRGTTLLADLTGTHYVVETPVIRNGQTRLRVFGSRLTGSGVGIFKLSGPVEARDWKTDLLASRAELRDRIWTFDDVVGYSRVSDAFMFAGRGAVLGDHYQLNHNVAFTIPGPSGSEIGIQSVRAEGNAQCMTLEQRVKVTDGSLHLSGSRAHVTSNQLSVVGVKVSSPEIDEGRSKLAVLPLTGQPIWMFGNVELKDLKGNWMRGGTLTFDRQTGKISVFKNDETVKIKLHL